MVYYTDDAAIKKRTTQTFVPTQYEHFYRQNQMHDNHQRTAQMQARGGGQIHSCDVIQISGRTHIKLPRPS